MGSLAALWHAPRLCKGVFWSHPGRFWSENPVGIKRWIDMVDAAPMLYARTHVDVAVIGANPILVALVARTLARRGQRVLVALMDALDPWPYDLIDNPVVHRLLKQLVGYDGQSPRETLTRLWRDCVAAVGDTNGRFLAANALPGMAIPDFDGSVWFYIKQGSDLTPATGVQANLIAQFRGQMGGISPLPARAALGRQRVVRAGSVVACSHDHAQFLAPASGYESEVDMVCDFESVLQPRLTRLGTGLCFAHEGELMLRRVLADLVVSREFERRDEGVETLLLNLYQQHGAIGQKRPEGVKSE